MVDNRLPLFLYLTRKVGECQPTFSVFSLSRFLFLSAFIAISFYFSDILYFFCIFLDFFFHLFKKTAKIGLRKRDSCRYL